MKEIQHRINGFGPMFYTVKEAAVVPDVANKTIRRFFDKGPLHSSPICKKPISRGEVENFFEAARGDKPSPRKEGK